MVFAEALPVWLAKREDAKELVEAAVDAGTIELHGSKAETINFVIAAMSRGNVELGHLVYTLMPPLSPEEHQEVMKLVEDLTAFEEKLAAEDAAVQNELPPPITQEPEPEPEPELEPEPDPEPEPEPPVVAMSGHLKGGPPPLRKFRKIMKEMEDNAKR